MSPSLHLIFGLIFLFILLASDLKDFKIISNPLFSYIGKISFSIYIIHFAILDLSKHIVALVNMSDYSQAFVPIFILQYLITFVLSGAIATLTYELIELPVQKFGRKYIDKKWPTEKIVKIDEALIAK